MISIEIIGGNRRQVREIKKALFGRLPDLEDVRIVTIKGSSSVCIGQKNKQAPFLRVTWQSGDNLYTITSRLTEEAKMYNIQIMPMACDLEGGRILYFNDRNEPRRPDLRTK